MREQRNNIIKWFLAVLFTGYVGGITLFTHSHIIDQTTYVHSHPFKGEHAHTEGQLILLHQFFHTIITSTVVPDVDLSDKSEPETVVYPDLYNSNPFAQTANNLIPRAPPAAA